MDQWTSPNISVSSANLTRTTTAVTLLLENPANFNFSQTTTASIPMMPNLSATAADANSSTITSTSVPEHNTTVTFVSTIASDAPPLADEASTCLCYDVTSTVTLTITTI